MQDEYSLFLKKLRQIDKDSDIEIPEKVFLAKKVIMLKNLCDELPSKQNLTSKEYDEYLEITRHLTRIVKSFLKDIEGRRIGIEEIKNKYPYFAGLKKAREFIRYYLWQLKPISLDRERRKHLMTIRRKKERIYKRIMKRMS